MGFFKKGNNSNYDLLSGFAWHVPGVGGMFGLIGWLLVGTLLGSLLTVPFTIFGGASGEEYAMLISYPVMFIPAMIAARNISNRNMAFETGYTLDNNHFTRFGGWITALFCMIATFGLGFIMDTINAQMPEMPKWLEDALDSMTQGKLWVDFLCVSIMAPICEEWLCRGTVLRGLLNYKRKDKEGNEVRGLKPWLAIVLSALFFAVIHMNPWQAVPAFALGCLFGYVYYKTGSLKLTMLMHFTNNTLALIMSQIDSLKDADSWFDILPLPLYCVIAVIFAAFIAWFCIELKKVPSRQQGNNDEIVQTEL